MSYKANFAYFFPILWAILISMSFVTGQIQYDPATNSLVCSKLEGSYCMNGSMGGSTMVSCVSSDVAVVTSCNIELSSILPEGFAGTAVCYEPTSDSGRAVCAFNGTGYHPDGGRSPVLETALCDNISPPADDKHRPGSKRAARFIDRLPQKISSLLSSRSASIPSAEDNKSIVERSFPIQSTIHCSNPFSTQGFVPVEHKGTSISTPTGAGTIPFLPTMETLEIPSFKHFHMAQETTGNPTDLVTAPGTTPDMITTSHATTTTYNGTTTITRILTVTGNASTTTVVLTSTDYPPSSSSTSSVQTSFVMNSAGFSLPSLFNTTEFGLCMFAGYFYCLIWYDWYSDVDILGLCMAFVILFSALLWPDFYRF